MTYIQSLLFQAKSAMMDYGRALRDKDDAGISSSTTSALDALDGLAELARAPSGTEPPGWQLMPKVPTRAMLKFTHNGEGSYAALLANAPRFKA